MENVPDKTGGLSTIMSGFSTETCREIPRLFLYKAHLEKIQIFGPYSELCISIRELSRKKKKKKDNIQTGNKKDVTCQHEYDAQDQRPTS